MKCNSCGKDIPVTSQVCPFCLANIEVKKENDDIEVLNSTSNNMTNLTTINGIDINNNNSELNFGDITNTSYDSKNDTLTAIYAEKKKKRLVFIPIIVVALISIIVIVLLLIIKGPKVYPYQYYQSLVDSTFEYLDDAFIGSNDKHSGTYRLFYTIDEEKNDIEGTLQLDTSKKILNVSGKIKKNVPAADLWITESILKFNIVGDGNVFGISADPITDTNIQLIYDDISGLLKNKQYDLSIVSESIHDAINDSLKEMEYTTTKNIKVVTSSGEKEANKISLKLDNNGKKKFISAFYSKLIDDQNLLHELAKAKGVKNEDIKNQMIDLMVELETKHAYESEYETYINFYYRGKEIYGYELDMTKDEKGYKYFLEVLNNKIIIKQIKDDTETFLIGITRKKEQSDENTKITYSFDGHINNKKLIINFELLDDINKVIKPKELENIKNIKDFSNEELVNIKSKMQNYTSNTDWILKLPSIFDIKCSSNLQCGCNGDNCLCTNGKYSKTCTKQSIKPRLF